VVDRMALLDFFYGLSDGKHLAVLEWERNKPRATASLPARSGDCCNRCVGRALF
jgi:hypothetical protein